jgi:hypothetical protein
MILKKMTVIAMTVVVSTAVAHCKKEDKEDAAETESIPPVAPGESEPAADVAPELEKSDEVMGYALNALSSATPKGAGAGLALDSNQSTNFPSCSENGEPWDVDTNARMQPSNPNFAMRAFECQLVSNESPETARGQFEQNHHILCELEKSVGTAIEYSETGKEYAIKIKPSLACGFNQRIIDEIDEMTAGAGFDATVTATSYATGGWQKSLQLASEMVNFKIYMTANATTVAFKNIETWSQADRLSGGDSNAAIADDATGTRGAVISIDIPSGTLRAELIDTYWSRRTRMYVKGVLDVATGSFSSITEGSGLTGNFDISVHNGMSGLYGEVATVKGSLADGFMFNSARYSCNSPDCDTTTSIRTDATVEAVSKCDVEGGCAGNTGISVGTAAEDFDFWMLGAALESQTSAWHAAEDWLIDAGLLTFTEAGKAPVLE